MRNFDKEGVTVRGRGRTEEAVKLLLRHVMIKRFRNYRFDRFQELGGDSKHETTGRQSKSSSSSKQWTAEQQSCLCLRFKREMAQHCDDILHLNQIPGAKGPPKRKEGNRDDERGEKCALKSVKRFPKRIEAIIERIII